MTYATFFAAPIPQANRENYETHARKAADIFMKHGATEYREYWADDVPAGELTSFVKAVDLQAGEAVVIGFSSWPDKQTCQTAMQQLQSGGEMAALGDMPFDGKRLIYGSFDLMFALP